MRTYCQYKHSINAEDYVKCTFSRADRSILAKFRCGILQLHIETGRFNNTKLEDRVCSMCETNNIEDEFHFLCICPYYSSERLKLYNKVMHGNPVFEQLDDREKFNLLMNKCNMQVLKFLRLAWLKRKERLYV